MGAYYPRRLPVSGNPDVAEVISEVEDDLRDSASRGLRRIAVLLGNDPAAPGPLHAVAGALHELILVIDEHIEGRSAAEAFNNSSL